MMQSFITLLVAITALQTTPIQKAETQKAKIQKPLEKRFDFWLGKWDAKWKYPDGSIGHATNEITRILNGKVIKENFIVKDKKAYKGMIGLSFSVYNPGAKKWNQTWVDNQGAYLDFYGKFDGDKRIFQRDFTGSQGKYKGKKISQRMVFHNIKADSFDWDWELSLDGGKTWKLNWRINYTRIK